MHLRGALNKIEQEMKQWRKGSRVRMKENGVITMIVDVKSKDGQPMYKLAMQEREFKEDK